MPLGTREVLLIMHAQDRMSGVFQTIGKNFNDLDKDATDAAKKQMATGAALLGVGAGITAVGTAGLSVYAEMGRAAQEYNREAILTMTQTQGLGISLNEIKEVARSVAKDIPVPFEQLQGSLYDIFSSMDVNLVQSQTLLENFARGAVAGQVAIQKSSQATIGLMNAFKVPIEDVTKVMDLQFQLVATGVGTYDQFAGVLGLVSPSAVRAGQSMENMAGMMAFLTRNGLSTSAAAASAGRALDSMANPKTVAHFKDIGINIADANGNFRPMVDIVQDLATKFKDLNPEQRSAQLKELFKSSGGTIQAMRFWNTAVENVPALKQYTAEMHQAGGAMDRAFGMFEEHDPGFQMQLLKNNLAVLSTEVGDKFLPVLAKLSGWMIKAVQWFDNLNPAIKNTVLIVGLIIPVIVTLLGIVVAAVGAFMVLSAVATFLGVTVGTLVGIVAGVVAAIVALVAAGVLLYQHWTGFNQLVNTVWNSIKVGGQAAWNFLLTMFQGISSWLGTVLPPILQFFQAIFESVWGVISFVISAFWTLAQPILDIFDQYIAVILIPVLQTFMTIGIAVFQAIGEIIQWWWDKIFMPVFNFVVALLTDVVGPAFKLWWDIVTVVFQAVAAIVQVTFNILKTIFEMIVGLLVALLAPAFRQFRDTAVSVMNAIADITKWAWNNVVKPVWNEIVSFWNSTLKPVFEAIGAVWGAVWDGLATAAKGAFNAAKGVIVSGINGIIDNINSLMSGAVSGVNALVDAYNSVPGAPHVDKIKAPQIPRLHSGGMVTAAGMMRNDEVLRILQVGEGIVNRRAMQQLGPNGLANINQGRGGGNTLNINEGAIVIHVDGADPSTVQKQVQDGVSSALSAFYRELKAS